MSGKKLMRRPSIRSGINGDFGSASYGHDIGYVTYHAIRQAA